MVALGQQHGDGSMSTGVTEWEHGDRSVGMVAWGNEHGDGSMGMGALFSKKPFFIL